VPETVQGNFEFAQDKETRPGVITCVRPELSGSLVDLVMVELVLVELVMVELVMNFRLESLQLPRYRFDSAQNLISDGNFLQPPGK